MGIEIIKLAIKRFAKILRRSSFEKFIYTFVKFGFRITVKNNPTTLKIINCDLMIENRYVIMHPISNPLVT